jgi:hypothetical protein
VRDVGERHQNAVDAFVYVDYVANGVVRRPSVGERRDLASAFRRDSTPIRGDEVGRVDAVEVYRDAAAVTDRDGREFVLVLHDAERALSYTACTEYRNVRAFSCHIYPMSFISMPTLSIISSSPSASCPSVVR